MSEDRRADAHSFSTSHPRFPHRSSAVSGQALLELAIFGSLLLLLLGALLNFGLNAEYNQQVMMESFRKALVVASGAGTGSAAVIRDNPLPNPSSPFAVGLVLPVAASANVTKNFQMGEGGGSSKFLLDLDDTINVETTTSVDGTIREFTVGTASNFCDVDILSFDLIRKQCLKDSSPWCCSKIDQLFAGIRDMGVQPGGVRASDLNATLEKTESSLSVTTTHAVDWQDQMTRTIVTRPLGDESGTVKTETITVTPKDQDTSTTWSTPWE